MSFKRVEVSNQERFRLDFWRSLNMRVWESTEYFPLASFNTVIDLTASLGSMIFPRAETPIQNYRLIRKIARSPTKKVLLHPVIILIPWQYSHVSTAHLAFTNRYTQYATELLYYNIYFLCPIFAVSQQDPEWSLPPFNKGRWFCAAATNLFEDEMKKKIQWICVFFCI